MSRHLAFGIIGLALVAGCSAASTPSELPTAGGLISSPAVSRAPSATPTPADNPIDASIAPVSLSDPSPEAKHALELCMPPAGAKIIGMGLVAHARDVPEYVPLWGVEPELQTDAPAWVVAFDGRVTLPRGYWADDPVCVVIDGTATTYMPGLSGLGTKVVPPLEAPRSPTMALPPPLP